MISEEHHFIGEKNAINSRKKREKTFGSGSLS
jgi:hypothetical protein